MTDILNPCLNHLSAVALLCVAAVTAGPAGAQNTDIQDNGTQDTDAPAVGRCVLLSTVADRRILNDREIYLALQDGRRLRMTLGEVCPQLSFQGVFTFSTTRGELCAGQDRIVTRSGDDCLIGGFSHFEGEPPPRDDHTQDNPDSD